MVKPIQLWTLFLDSAILAPGPTSQAVTYTNPAGSPDRVLSHLTEKCHFLLPAGPCPFNSSCVPVCLVSLLYISFCHQNGHVGPGGALLPADEQSLIRHLCPTTSATHPSKCTSVLCVLFTSTIAFISTMACPTLLLTVFSCSNY